MPNSYLFKIFQFKSIFPFGYEGNQTQELCDKDKSYVIKHLWKQSKSMNMFSDHLFGCWNVYNIIAFNRKMLLTPHCNGFPKPFITVD